MRPASTGVNGFDWYGRAGFCSHPCGTDNLYFRAGVQQRDYARAGKLADPDMLHAIWLTVLIALITVPVNGIRYAAGPAGDALYLPGASDAADAAGYPVRRLTGGGGSGLSALYGSNGPLGGWLDEHNLQVMFAAGYGAGDYLCNLSVCGTRTGTGDVKPGATKTKRLCCWARQAGRCSAASRCRIFAGHCSMGWC